jgi:uncharacterized protein YlzI (FlbEa/FlbD family)
MNKYEIQYKNGKKIIVEAKTALEVIKRYDLCTKENMSTKLKQF